ncbi:MAG: DUF262 domain-containing protein [Holophagales bacterium]|nr:DUF262 domain-containing protein [Holophagales bacterium]
MTTARSSSDLTRLTETWRDDLRLPPRTAWPPARTIPYPRGCDEPSLRAPQDGQDVIHLYEKGRLNLSPGFQRDSVWTDSDRQKLIESILRGYPLPSVFFYRRETDGQIYFDVIDGKQRIETILRFTGRIRGNRFATKKIQLPGEDEKDWVDWDKLKRRRQQHKIEGYTLLTIQVDGELSEVIDLFVKRSTRPARPSPPPRSGRRSSTTTTSSEAARLARRSEGYFRAPAHPERRPDPPHEGRRADVRADALHQQG